MITQHVHHSHLRNGNLEQIGALRHASSYEQSSIRSALYCQLPTICVFIFDQPLTCADKIIKYILLFVKHACFVPCFTILAATAHTYTCIYSALLQKENNRRTEAGCYWNIKPSIAIHQCRVISI